METFKDLFIHCCGEFLSEWRSSLKGMETINVEIQYVIQEKTVRMEVFPERDGNYLHRLNKLQFQCPGPNGGLP